VGIIGSFLRKETDFFTDVTDICKLYVDSTNVNLADILPFRQSINVE
jgi:hypothetical protein